MSADQMERLAEWIYRTLMGTSDVDRRFAGIWRRGFDYGWVFGVALGIAIGWAVFG